MKKRNWTTAAVILGIALLAAAVALMPACDTNPLDACAELDGYWEVQMTMTNDTCGTGSHSTDYVDFMVFPETGEVEMVWEDGFTIYMTGEIDCDDEDFTITWESNPVSVGTDCTVTMAVAINGSFDNNDEFSGTWISSNNYEGTTCSPSQEDCAITYNISAVRQP